MKKTKLLPLFLCLMMLFHFGLLNAVPMDAAVTTPGKVTGVTTVRQSKTSVRIKWNKVSNATGYVVYMKTNNGSFKRLYGVRTSYFNKTGLKLGSTYYFKVRAYRKSGGKTYYGPYSSIVKRKMVSYVYLVRHTSPYYKHNYYVYDGAKTISMANNEYFNSFKLNGSSSYAFFNLKGKFSKISFTLGETTASKYDSEVAIYGDDELIRTIKVTGASLPKTYTVPLTNVYKLAIYCDSTSYKYIGFGDVRLYY